MGHPLRVRVQGSGWVDVEVDASPDATVGDLADALAERTGGAAGLTVVGRWPVAPAAPPARSALLDAAGPRAGSTVELVPEDPEPTPPNPSPVSLVGPGRHRIPLDYGRTELDGAVVDVGRDVVVRSTGASTARVGGSVLLGSARLRTGDLLFADGRPWTVEIAGPLRPPLRGGWLRAHRGAPADNSTHGGAAVELPTPPAPIRIPGFPVLSASVPLLMGAALWLGTGSLLSAAFVLFSVVFVVASALESRREARAETRSRVREFRDELGEAAEQLERLAVEQRGRHADEGWSPDQLRDLAEDALHGPATAVWRAWDDPSRGWTARLGTGRRPLEARIVQPRQGRRDLRRELAEIARRHSAVDDVVTIDLAELGGLVVLADGEDAVAVARTVVLQLATSNGPDRLGVRVACSPDRAANWSALRWLPHARTRRGRQVVVVDGAEDATDPWRSDPSADAIEQPGPAPIVIWVAPPGEQPPPGPRAVLTVSGGRARLEVRRADGGVEVVEPVELEHLDHDDAEPVARRLAGLGPSRSAWPTDPARTSGLVPPTGIDELPDRVPLSRVCAATTLGSDPDRVLAQWHRGGRRDGLATPIGVDGRGGVVNLDLAAEGPHALVAGTTGSGKSELLRTLLVAAALHHPPERLQVLLVDYKGGAAFGPLDRLPHVVGTITDLSGPLAARALASLGAELRRREAAVAEVRADRWDGAALWVVVDELATLVAEQPGFVDGLVDLAQRGRSLGIHLVLATQRPAGVVTDAIRANVTTRIALRVADEEDSRDVVDSPAAAHLRRDRPGRALVRVGPGRVMSLQTAFCGGVTGPGPPVVVRSWDPGPDRFDPADGVTGRPGATELEVAVRTAATAAERAGLPPVRRPWLDPLPTRVVLSDLPPPDHPGALVIGLVDRPDLQSREPLVLDLDRDGGAVVLGASGSGRSTVVRTIAAAASNATDGTVWRIYVIESRPSSADLAGTGVVGDVIDVDDVERVHRLLRSTVEAMGRRPADGPVPQRTVLVVDGMAGFVERHERVDRGVAVELLCRIAREGRSGGVHVVATAHRRTDVPAELAGVLGARLVLRCASADDAVVLGLDDSAAHADVPPGRCRAGADVAQVAVCERPGGEVRPAPPPPVLRLPSEVPLAELSPARDLPWLLPVGLDGDTLATASIDLAHHHAVVAGPPRSGVSTALATLAAGHPGSRLLLRADADELAAMASAALADATNGRPQLILIDRCDELLDAPDPTGAESVLDELVRASRELPIRVVVGGDVDALLRCYQESVASLRRGRSGLLLGGDPDLHAALWHTTLPTRSDLPAGAGRGWAIAPGAARPIQVARP